MAIAKLVPGTSSPKIGIVIIAPMLAALVGPIWAKGAANSFDGTAVVGMAAVDRTLNSATVSDGTRLPPAVSNAITKSSTLQVTELRNNVSFSPVNNALISIEGNPYQVQNANRSWSLSSPDSHTLRFEVRPGDQWGGLGTERSEIAGKTLYSPGTTITVSYNFMLEPGNANTAGVGGASSFVVVGQFHSHDNPTAPSPVHPPFAIYMTGEHTDIWVVSAATGSTAEKDTEVYHDPNPIQRGVYYSMTIVANFQNNADGFLEVWRNGVQIVNYHGPIGYGQSVYWKEGVYRSPTTITMAADYQNTTVTVR